MEEGLVELGRAADHDPVVAEEQAAQRRHQRDAPDVAEVVARREAGARGRSGVDHGPVVAGRARSGQCFLKVCRQRVVRVPPEDVPEQGAGLLPTAKPEVGLRLEKQGGGFLAGLEIVLEKQHRGERGGKIVDLRRSLLELPRPGNERPAATLWPDRTVPGAARPAPSNTSFRRRRARSSPGSRPGRWRRRRQCRRALFPSPSSWQAQPSQ